MIEILTFIILIIIFALAVNYIFGSVAIFLINITLIALLVSRINSDIKKRKVGSYYMIAIFITALLFIFRNYSIIPVLFEFMEEALILNICQALILIFIIAYLINYLHSTYISIMNRYRK